MLYDQKNKAYAEAYVTYFLDAFHQASVSKS